MHVTGCSGARKIPSAPARKKGRKEAGKVEKDAVKLTPCSIRVVESQTMELDV